MSDDIPMDKSVALVVQVSKKGTKMTADLLEWAIRQYLKNKDVHKGKQTVRQLVKQGQGVQNIEVTDRNIKSFEQVAKKYGVDFALKKDTIVEPPKYLVFFKARDADAITSAFQEFTAQTLNKDKKPSIRKQLHFFKEMLKKQTVDKTKHKNKEAEL